MLVEGENILEREPRYYVDTSAFDIFGKSVPIRNFKKWYSLRVTHNAYCSLLTHAKQLLLVTYCDTFEGIGAVFQAHV